MMPSAIAQIPHLIAHLGLLLVAALILRHGLALSGTLTIASISMMLVSGCLVSGLVGPGQTDADDGLDERYRTLRALLVMLSVLISLSLLTLILR